MSEKPTQLVNCPKCGQPATDFVSVDKAMRAIIAKSGEADPNTIPPKVCKSCYSGLTGMVSKGARLRLEQKAREKNKHMLWKSRVNLVRQARQYMTDKAFSDAAVTYEKYIRVLEIAYDLKPGQLGPDVFGKSAKSKELTVIATAYWDLLRIYDTSPSYRDRMMRAAEKLAEFLPFSPIFPDVIKRAQTFRGQAKNPDIVSKFLSLVKANNPRCFVVTASYGYPQHPTVQFYREYRDQTLTKTAMGRLFIKFYYRVSPPFADFIQERPALKNGCRYTLEILKQSLFNSRS